MRIITKREQASGAFNGGEIIENKPIGFNREGGLLRPYSNLFYWANAEGQVDSTIGLHPHQGFEIMSFVIDGEVRHYDTLLDKWQSLSSGDAQVIRAGNGISHSEWMGAGSRMFQIWLDPDLSKTMSQPASYDDYPATDIPTLTEGKRKVHHYAGAKGIMQLDTQDISIERWTVYGDIDIQLDPGRTLSLYLLSGTLSVNGEDLPVDSFLVADAEEALAFAGTGDVFVITSPTVVDYDTYGEIMQRRMRT
jgi:redox-sensitive bicupin YhaK (pirin superfamily)